MGKRKISCRNTRCKHHIGETCECCIEIDGSGRCASFERGIVYYFGIVFAALDRKNYIDAVEVAVNPDLRIGMFYVMECYGLGFSVMDWGTCRMFMLKDEESGKPLNRVEIAERKIIDEKFHEHLENFNNGMLPTGVAGASEKDERQQEAKSKELGWVSPMGEFTESPFGTHEESAERICEKNGFEEEYWRWVKETGDNEAGHLMRDYLASQKGYCLIHNPTGGGGYLVTHLRPLTKRQKEFLYGYFMDMGDRFKAEQFIEEES